MNHTLRRTSLLAALMLLALVLTGCPQGDEDCNSWAGSYGSSGWSMCGDGRERKIDCDLPRRDAPAPPPGTPVKCTCSLGGVVGKDFLMTDPIGLGTIDSAVRTANEQCGWKLSAP